MPLTLGNIGRQFSAARKQADQMTHTLAINGIMLHYRLEGPKHLPVLVFSNALGTDLRLWDPLLPHLAGRYRFLRYDQRGQGLSDCPPAPYAIDDHIGDLAGLLDALGLRKVNLCGLSVGGLVAQGLAARRPDLVSRLILCGPAGKIGPAGPWEAHIRSVREGGMASIADAALAFWFSPGFRARHAAELALWRHMLARTPLEGYVGTCAALRDADLSRELTRLTQPSLCIAGEQDQTTPPDLVRRTAELIPHGRFEVIANAGHLPCVEQPAALARLISGFIGEQEMPLNRFEQGMEVRRSVLGDAHVDRAGANQTDFDAPFQSFITEGAWGSVWNRPGLSKRDRSLLTIALLAALGHKEELALHLRASRNTGASLEEVQETLLHLAVYAGVPASNAAFRIAKDVFDEPAEQDGR